MEIHLKCSWKYIRQIGFLGYEEAMSRKLKGSAVIVRFIKNTFLNKILRIKIANEEKPRQNLRLRWKIVSNAKHSMFVRMFRAPLIEQWKSIFKSNCVKIYINQMAAFFARQNIPKNLNFHWIISLPINLCPRIVLNQSNLSSTLTRSRFPIQIIYSRLIQLMARWWQTFFVCFAALLKYLNCNFP